MKEFIVSTWMMIKIAMAYALSLIGMVIGIPGHLLYRIGTAIVGYGERIRNRIKENDESENMDEDIDM